MTSLSYRRGDARTSNPLHDDWNAWCAYCPGAAWHGRLGDWHADPSLCRGSAFRSRSGLDASRYFIVLPDAIGAGKSSKPSDGMRAKFPHYNYDDMVQAQYRLVSEGLGIRHLRLVLGTRWVECTPGSGRESSAVHGCAGAYGL